MDILGVWGLGTNKCPPQQENSSISSIKWKVLRTLYSSTFFKQFLPLILLFPNPSIFHNPQLSLKFMTTFFFFTIFVCIIKSVHTHKFFFFFLLSLPHAQKLIQNLSNIAHMYICLGLTTCN